MSLVNDGSGNMVIPVSPMGAGDQYFNVTSTAFITVPTGCCFTLAVENTSADAINVQNANLVITRVA